MKINRHNTSDRRFWSRLGGVVLVVVGGGGAFAVGMRPAASEAPPADSSASESIEASVPPSLRAESEPDATESAAAEAAAESGEPPAHASDDSAAAAPPAAPSDAAVTSDPDPRGETAEQLASEIEPARQAGDLLIQDTMRRLTHGPAFEAKLTQHIWAQGREVVGVGRYEQAGDETGWFSMEMMIPTASGKCLLQQMSDGRLSWTREQVGDQVRLRRVDVGRLDELVPKQKHGPLRPALRVGGLVELLQRIARDYELVRTAGKVDGRPVWVLRGALREQTAEAIEEASGDEGWPSLCPREVLVAIAADDNEEGFGKGLPARIEFWSDRPDEMGNAKEEDAARMAQRNLVSLLKIYDARRINAAPQQHFSFETGESDVQFINDTERYVEMFGVKLTAKERVMLLR